MSPAIIVLIIYFVITTAIGLYYGRKETTTTDDFMVGGRRFGVIVIFLCTLANYIGAASTIGSAGWVYQHGLSQIWLAMGGTVVFLFIGFFMVGKIQKLGKKCNIYTVGDFVELRFSRGGRYFTGLLMWFAFMAITAFQYMGMGQIIVTVTGMPFVYAIVISAAITVLYTSIGGLWSVAITQVFQGILTLVGITIMVPIVVSAAGGFSGIAASVPPEFFSLTGFVTPPQAVTAFLITFLGIIPMQDWWQRGLAAKDAKSASRGFIGSAFGMLFIAGCAFLIGFSGKALIPDLANPEQIFPILILEYLSPWVGGLVLACLVAIIMSTASACLLVPTTHFVKDFWQGIYRKDASDAELLKVSKISTVIFGFLALVFVFAGENMLSLFIISADVLGASLALPILAGFFVPRVGKISGNLGMAAGFIGWALGYLGWTPLGVGPVLVGAGLSIIVMAISSFIFPAIDKETLIKLGFVEEQTEQAESI